MESDPFFSHDGMMWRLRLEPGDWSVANSSGLRKNAIARPTNSKIQLQAIATPEERRLGRIDRVVDLQFSAQGARGKVNVVKKAE